MRLGNTFSEIIGMEKVKELVRELIESRLKFESLYKNLPIKISTSKQS